MLKKLLLILVLMVISMPAQTGTDVLKSLQNKFSSIDNFVTDFRESGGKNPITGKIYYKKDNMYRVEFSSVNIISDGKTVWNFNKRDNKVVINDVNTASSPMSLNTLLYDYPERSNVALEKGNVLVLTPKKNSGMQFREVRIWVSKDNLVSKMSIKRGNQSSIVLELSNFKVNPGVRDDMFSFTPPKGSEVIDLR